MAKLKLLFLEELAQVCKHYSFKRLKAKSMVIVIPISGVQLNLSDFTGGST
jgi:hypothetical protein